MLRWCTCDHRKAQEETEEERFTVLRDSPTAGQLSLTYYGHCAFLWASPTGRRVLIDPYRNRHDRYWFLRQFPAVESDLALITHAHFDHDAADHLLESTAVLRLPGDFHDQDVFIKGIVDLHSGRWGREGLRNVMFRLEIAGLRFLHIGDNRAQLPPDVIQQVGSVDVLMVTVDDSCHLLSYTEVDDLITLLNPRAVIPMHYLIPELTTQESTLLPPDGWLATQRTVRYLRIPTIQISPQSLPTSREVWVLDPSPESFRTPFQERPVG
jgi:L-ascorbate metabolism protein UlaG (beta-lactamase superfamily)